jgi:hypothetical protein
MARQTISAGAPPILWSSVNDAFEKINANFTELYISMGGEGTDLSALTTNVSPAETNELELGAIDKRWRNIWLEDTGLNIGAATISAIDNTINLPTGSRVGGMLIKDPEDTTFNTIASAGQDNILATSARDILNLSGSFIGIATDASTNTVNFINTGITTAGSGNGISISGTNNITITNTGALDVQSGLGISVSETDQIFTITNEGIVGLEAGTGITIGARSPITGRVVITNSAPATGIFWYRSIAVSGTAIPQLPISADTAAETLTFIAGAGIGISTADKSGLLTDRVTFTNLGVTSLTASGNIIADNSTGSVNLTFDNRTDIVGSVYGQDSTVLVDSANRSFIGDVRGSVFGDDSTKIVDAVENKVYAEFFGNLTGNITGNVTGDVNGNVNGNVYGSIFTNQIESEDSSQIIIKPLTRFNSDVVIENDLSITQSLTVNGSRVINLSELKSIVAESVDFADFQTKIASLL